MNNEEIIFEDEDFLSTIEAAKVVGVSRTTINYWIINYGLKADVTPGKRYRIRYIDLKIFLALNKRDKRIKLKRKSSKYKIAIIEPTVITRKNYIEWLKGDYDIECVSNLIKPLRELKKISPDIILMDINLSEDKDYFYIIDEIKKEIKLRTALIIIITKKYNEDDVVSGLEKGACDYVKKPVGQNELKARIKNLLRFFIDI
ncbi:response regulator [Brachyspira aalborgi]|jgi:two-component response regulator|uniref:Response regulator n=1 Tax=Brachyspira aalborgi TaxID=29522 RepID=A0A5C8FDZ8_9SPIR|nr:response regulator [Brachyspira aalborgi]MBS4764185.1 response regulator [Brachyspira sp.]CCY74244.1 two-component response regulator [Brachyspira sp. CAG:700]TXJ11094.1 response regulator [Brachyspira aalborgi]TXJ21665.1 response regulator [Brachyspira aalborgi]TXJ25542.1 response regulator [Brachyspira aalborgi]